VNPRRVWLLLGLGAALVLPAGCDDPLAPLPGAIRVVIVANGEDVITEGLRASVANGPAGQFGPDVRELLIGGLPSGQHTVRIDGLAVNCQLASANPQTVEVTAGGMTDAVFQMFCTVRTGSVRITATTTGSDIDPNGYGVNVIGGPSAWTVAANGTATIGNIREGPRLVTLTDVAPNCVVTGPDTATVSVQVGSISDAAFSIECVTASTLTVGVSTTGADPDPNGYRVRVDAVGESFTASQPTEPNATVTFSPLRSGGEYRVTLEGIAANCQVAGANPTMIAVAAGSTTRVDFNVLCEPARTIAFVSDRDGNPEIYTVRSNGAGLTRLTSDASRDGDPAWSPDGSRIAFVTDRHNDPELYVMNADGSDPVRITTRTGGDDGPSWSPDGTRIVFRSVRDVNSEIYTVNADGTDLTRLTNNAAVDAQPDWSSTGRIVFVSNRDHSAGEIYVMNADGSNVVRLTNNDVEEVDPAWSPDGSMIAFARRVECYYGCVGDIFVMNADGSGQRRLATQWSYGYDHIQPDWSPNGRAIAFTARMCDYYYGCASAQVRVVDLDGTGVDVMIDNAFDATWRP
jgi:Tol biopolymer transport system component